MSFGNAFLALEKYRTNPKPLSQLRQLRHGASKPRKTAKKMDEPCAPVGQTRLRQLSQLTGVTEAQKTAENSEKSLLCLSCLSWLSGFECVCARPSSYSGPFHGHVWAAQITPWDAWRNWDGPAFWLDGLRVFLETECFGDWPEEEWLRFKFDSVAFLDSWGAKAHSLGWSEDDLFGVDSEGSYGRQEAFGLIAALRGGTVEALTAEAASITTTSGQNRIFHRCSDVPREAVWEGIVRQFEGDGRI